MEISDIQLEGSEIAGDVILTFCSTEGWEDVMTIKIKTSEV